MPRKTKSAKKPVPAPPPLPVETESARSDFDALEDRIRGEEILTEQAGRKAKEQLEIKKKLDKAEIDRRLEELRRKLGK